MLPHLRRLAGATQRRSALALLLCLSAVILFYWRILFTSQYTWLNNPDLVNQVLPWFQFQADEWRRSGLPLWDPHHWGGQSLIGQNQPGAVYPLNWLLFWMPLKHGHISRFFLNYYFVLVHAIAAFIMYALCRGLRRTRTASVFAGLAFSLGSYMGLTTWPQMLNGAVWAPLAILCWIRALSGKRPLANASLAGGVLGFSLLSGHHQAPMYTALSLLAIAACYWLEQDSRSNQARVKSIMLLVPLGLFTILVSAAQTLPSHQYWKIGYRWVNTQHPVTWNEKVPYIAHSEFSLNPVSLLGTVIPYLYNHSSPYLGFTVFSLAVIAVVLRWKLLEVRAIAWLSVGSLLFALGGSSLFHGIAYALVPYIDKSRNAAMAVFGLNIAVPCLAAFGLDALRASRAAITAVLSRASRLLLCIAAALFLLLMYVRLVQGDAVYGRHAEAFAANCALLLAGLFALRRLGHARWSSLAVLSTALMLFELSYPTAVNFHHKEAGWTFYNQLEAHHDLAAFLKSREGPFRIAMDSKDIPFNFGDWYGFDQTGGYTGISANIFDHYWQGNAQLLLGVRYHLAKQAPNPALVEVFSGAGDMKIFEDTRAFPRAWVVHRVRRAESGDVDRLLSQPLETLRNEAFLVDQDPPTLNGCETPGQVRIAGIGSTHTALNVDLMCPGMIILADTFAPGWSATIDGQDTRLIETYGFLRGVVAPAGRHRIEVTYKPATLYWGIALSALGILALVAIRCYAPPK